MRDPDGYLIEVGQYTQMSLDHFKKKRQLNRTALMRLQKECEPSHSLVAWQIKKDAYFSTGLVRIASAAGVEYVNPPSQEFPMTDPVPVLRREVDALIQMRLTTLNSTKPLTLRREPDHKRKITYPYRSV
jgi:hypothetical protein